MTRHVPAVPQFVETVALIGIVSDGTPSATGRKGVLVAGEAIVSVPLYAEKAGNDGVLRPGRWTVIASRNETIAV